MWYLVKGLSEIHDDPIRLSMTPVQSLIQVTNHVMKELTQLGLTTPLTTETMLTVSKNVFYGKMLIYVADYIYYFAEIWLTCEFTCKNQPCKCVNEKVIIANLNDKKLR